MKTFALCLSIVCCLVSSSFAPAPSAVDDLMPIPQEDARKFGKMLADEAAKIENPQVKIEADPEKANGVHKPEEAGVLAVPQRDLKESEELAAKFKSEKGAPLSLLFCHHIFPVIDGKTADASALRGVKIKDEEGNEHTVQLLLLSVRQVAEDDYRLYAWGYQDKPLVDAKFAQTGNGGNEPVDVQIKEIQQDQGTLVVTVFGKYQASFKVGHRKE